MACTIKVQGTIPEYLEIGLWKGNSSSGYSFNPITAPYTLKSSDIGSRTTCFLMVKVKDTEKESYEYVYYNQVANSKYYFINVGYNNDAHQALLSNSNTQLGTYCNIPNCLYKELSSFYINNTYDMLLNFENASLIPESLGGVPTQYKLQITGTIENAICNYENGAILNVGDKITITSNPYYEFETYDVHAYTIQINNGRYYMNTNTGGDIKYPTVLDRTLPEIVGVRGDYAPVVLNDNYIATSQKTYLTVRFTNGSLQNCTANYRNSEQYVRGKSLIITADEGYIFGEERYSYTLAPGNDVRAFVLSSDKKTLTANLTEEDISNFTTLEVNTNEVFAVSENPDSKYVLDLQATLTKCLCNYNNGDTILVGSTLKITADTGYEFTGNYQLTINGVAQYWQKSSDLTELYYNLTAQPNSTEIVLVSGEITATVRAVDVVAFTKIYNPTDSELDKLAGSLIVSVGQETVLDYSVYIAKLYLLPFDVSALRLKDKQSIILRNHDTRVTSFVLNKWKFDVDGGEITVPGKYENVYDFKNTKCQIYVPWYDIVEIEPKYVVGQTVSLSYLVNFYEGFLYVFLSSTLDGQVFFTDKVNIAIDLPFYSPTPKSGPVSKIAVPKVERVFQPYISVTRNIPKVVDGVFGKDNKFYAKLETLTGWAVVEDIDLDIDIPANEEQELRNILKGGVFI